MLAIPTGTDRPQRRLPLMNLALIAANVIIFLIGKTLAPHMPPNMPQADYPASWQRFLLNPEPGNPSALHLYQFITYQFLHEGFSHIGFNMLFLYVFGNNLNEKLGHVGYLAFYLAGGVFAGCGQVLTSNAPTLGASGAISAVTGLFLVLLPRIHIRIFVWILLFIDRWEVPSMYFILLKIAQDVYEQFTGDSGVAYMAHITGTLAGIIIGFLLIWTKLVQRDHYDLLAMLNRMRRRQEYKSVVAKGYDPFYSSGVPAQVRAPARGQVDDAPSAKVGSLRTEISRLLGKQEFKDAAQRYLELRAIDAAQVLPPAEQLDVGNQLMTDGMHAAAAGAYEDYLRTYPKGAAGQQDQITLMLAMIYSQYVGNPDRARELLHDILPRMHNPQERALAQKELQWLDSQYPPAQA